MDSAAVADFLDSRTPSSFPIDEVCEILGLDRSAPEWGVRWFRGASKEQMERLVTIGAANPAWGQNESPTLGELLETPGEPSYQGYVVYPPRDDARVTVDGITASDLDPETAHRLLERWKNADELRAKPDFTSRDVVHAWWD